MLALKLVRLCHAWAESRRQKHSKGERRADPRDSGNVNLGVFAGEFAHALAAGAARRDQGIAFPDDKYFGDAPLTGGDHGGYRSGFRASANGIGGILDIRPGENRARDGAKSRFNGKPQIRSVGAQSCFGRRRKKRFDRTHPGTFQSAAGAATGAIIYLGFAHFAEASTEMFGQGPA